MQRRLLFLLALLASGPLQAQNPPGYLILNVRVISLADAPPREADVVIRGSRIAAITAPGSAQPAGLTVIDGRNRFLIPGLIDSHVHLKEGDPLFLFTVNGVTSVQKVTWTDVTLAPDTLAVTPTVSVVRDGIRFWGGQLNDLMRGVLGASRLGAFGGGSFADLFGGRLVEEIRPKDTPFVPKSQVAAEGEVQVENVRDATPGVVRTLVLEDAQVLSVRESTATLESDYFDVMGVEPTRGVVP